MPVMMMMEWEAVSPEKYEEVRAAVNWEGDVPEGGMFHVVSFGDGKAYVADVWRSAEDFQRFAATRLMEGVRKAGITTEPRVTILPAHRIFSPGYAPVSA